MLTLIGLTSILAIVFLLISGRITPIVGLVLVPIVAALLGGFSLVLLVVAYFMGIYQIQGPT